MIFVASSDARGGRRVSYTLHLYVSHTCTTFHISRPSDLRVQERSCELEPFHRGETSPTERRNVGHCAFIYLSGRVAQRDTTPAATDFRTGERGEGG